MSGERPRNPKLERTRAIRSAREQDSVPRHTAAFNTLIEYVTGDTGMRELDKEIAKKSLEKIKPAERDKLRALLFERETIMTGLLDAVKSESLEDKGGIKKDCEKQLGYIKLIRQVMDE